MKTALIGYGRMGHEIERLLTERGHEVVLISDENNPLTVSALRDSGADVAIEFTTPDAAFANIATCLETGVAVVSGTTGWLARWDDAVAMCRRVGGALFYASNYSVGVNLFFRLNERLARMMDAFGQYGVRVDETHHIHKKDAPSGTAITIAEGIARNVSRLDGWQLTDGGAVADGKIPVTAYREGEVPGIHTVEWRSEVDAITLTHESFSRLGLATGAVMAAEYLRGRTGVYSMDDLLGMD